MLRWRTQTLRRLAADETGLTFPEVATATALALTTGAVGMTILMFAVRAEPARSDRAADVADARAMVERIGRDVRQGQTVQLATATELRLLTNVRGGSCTGSGTGPATLCSVTYACSVSCTRTVRPANATNGGQSQILVEGLTGDPVFSYPTSIYSSVPCPVPEGASAASTSNPAYVCIELAFPSERGDESITLTDGISLRNWFDP